jgi:uncharacterized membrane protein
MLRVLTAFVTSSLTIGVLVATASAQSSESAAAAASRGYRIVTTHLGAPAGLSVDVASMNDRRAIVGRAYSTTSEQAFPFLWTPARGFVRILGDEQGEATAINNRGVIVGRRFVGDLTFGFLWTADRGAVDLGSFLPSDINDHGQVAGICSDNIRSLGACLWENGVVTPINDGVATAINDKGQVVGQLGDAAFVWSARTGTTTLTGPGATTATDINKYGEIAGAVCPCEGDAQFHAARWDRSQRLADTLPPFSAAAAINSIGAIVGLYHPTAFETRAFAALADGASFDLGVGEARAVNDRLEAAGISWTPDSDVVELGVWQAVPAK